MLSARTSLEERHDGELRGLAPPPNSALTVAGFGTHRAVLLKALDDALLPTDVKSLARAVGPPITDIAPPSATRPEMIEELVSWVETRGREAKLVEAAMERNDSNAELEAVGKMVLEYLRATAPWYSAPNPIETCIVRRDQAFVDRLELRQKLQQLMPANGWGSLVVKGDARSGRSFTLELIMFVVGDTPDARIVHIDLSDAPADIGPGDLLRRIALQLGLDTDDIQPQQEQAPRWNAELADWLVGKVQNSDLTCWVVIDAIDKTRPRDETMDLIWKLAKAAANRPRLRVVLLACSEPPPDQVGALDEEIKPIDRGMVEAFFTLFYKHKGIDEPDGRLVRKAADAALRDVPDNGGDRLTVLQREVAKVARGIAEDIA